MYQAWSTCPQRQRGDMVNMMVASLWFCKQYKGGSNMARQAKKEEREKNIKWGNVLGADGPEKQVMGWDNYFDDTLQFPVTGRCVVWRAASPFGLGEEV